MATEYDMTESRQNEGGIRNAQLSQRCRLAIMICGLDCGGQNLVQGVFRCLCQVLKIALNRCRESVGATGAPAETSAKNRPIFSLSIANVQYGRLGTILSHKFCQIRSFDDFH